MIIYQVKSTLMMGLTVLLTFLYTMLLIKQFYLVDEVIQLKNEVIDLKENFNTYFVQD